jgi:mRNA interferase MazF
MTFTMPFEFGTVVLVPFPFTNLAASKRRPAVVVSNSAYDAIRGDVIVMAVTSQIRADPALREVPVVEWQDAGLLKPSVVKPVIATLEGSLVLRKLGVLERGDQAALRAGLQRILG